MLALTHLVSTQRRSLSPGVGPSDIHPSIVRLGLAMRHGKLTSTNVRAFALLDALIHFFQDFRLKPYSRLDQHIKRELDKQIDFLTTCRPLAFALGSIVRKVKTWLQKADYKQPEEQVLYWLIRHCDMFRNTSIVVGSILASELAAHRLIKPNDWVLVYGRVAAVQGAMLLARKQLNKNFGVVVIESPDGVEGRELAEILLRAGVRDVRYSVFSGLTYHMSFVDRVLIGAAAVLGNGDLWARCGTAAVAMAAKNKAVKVCAVVEMYKFTERTVVDAFAINELADHDADPIAEESPTSSTGNRTPPLEPQAIRPLYDVTPGAFIHFIMTENGGVPIPSVTSVMRQHAAQDAKYLLTNAPDPTNQFLNDTPDLSSM